MIEQSLYTRLSSLLDFETLLMSKRRIKIDRKLDWIPVALWTLAACAVPVAALGQVTYSPTQIRNAYGFNSLPTNVTGSGQTIAIIDFADSPNIASDLTTFDNDFGVAAPPSFSVVDENGGNMLPAAASSGQVLETSLDVEYAHAIAPGAKIVLVEGPDISTVTSSDLMTMANTAVSKGASVVSMSFGFANGADPGTEAQLDSTYARAGVTFVASSGDSGVFSYPASSPHVIGVGGTSLTIVNGVNNGYINATGGSYGGETTWNNASGSGGGGVDPNEPIPVYQAGVAGTASQTFRNIPDLSYDADPNTGVDIVINGTAYGYVGGTSAGAPQISGMIALANQLRAAQGLPLLSSDQALTMLYAAYADPVLYGELFHDISTGSISSGYDATTGYDNATGLGTPIANDVVEYLAGYAAPEPSSCIFAIVAGVWVMSLRRRAATLLPISMSM